MKQFLFLSQRRSGTGLVLDFIRSHPDIHCSGELFLSLGRSNTGSFYRWWLEEIEKDPSCLLPKGQIAAFSRFLDHYVGAHAQHKAVGFEILYDQLKSIPNAIAALRERDLRVLHLVRKNALRTFLSDMLNSMAAPLKRTAHHSDTVVAHRVHLVPNCGLLEEIRRRKEDQEQYRRIFSELFPYLELVYEDMTRNVEASAQTAPLQLQEQICDFFELPRLATEFKTSLKKTNPGLLRDTLENFDEVSEYLSANGFGDLIDDPPATETYTPAVSSGSLIYVEALSQTQRQASFVPSREYGSGNTVVAKHFALYHHCFVALLENVDLCFEQATQSLRNGEVEAALAKLYRTLELNPQHRQALFTLCELFDSGKQLAALLPLLEQLQTLYLSDASFQSFLQRARAANAPAAN